jgi:hypothetical protein
MGAKKKQQSFLAIEAGSASSLAGSAACSFDNRLPDHL